MDCISIGEGSAGRDFFGGERLGNGEWADSLIALRAATGEIAWARQLVHHNLWDYDTAHEFQTLNGITAKGGSMDGPGPAVVDGMLYVPSGYGNWGGLPGNVLLAFSVDGK